MSKIHRCPRSLRTLLAKSVVWLIAAAFVVTPPLFGYYLYLRDTWESYQAPPAPPLPPDMFVIAPAVYTPPTKAAEEADLNDEAEVIGVCVGEHARAYLVESMGFPRHVVNDVLYGRAVSVTYCDRRHCARVFTREYTSAPLDLDLGGWMEDKGMLLHLDGVHYSQETGENVTATEDAPLPYEEYPHVRTTWGSWRKAHPDTDVYVGPPLG